MSGIGGSTIIPEGEARSISCATYGDTSTRVDRYAFAHIAEVDYEPRDRARYFTLFYLAGYYLNAPGSPIRISRFLHVCSLSCFNLLFSQTMLVPVADAISLTTSLTKAQVEALGVGLVDMMTEDQLRAAMLHYSMTVKPQEQYVVSKTHLVQAWNNHWLRVVRMPAGGAHAGGAMQTGFEMELVSAKGVRLLLSHWKNYESIRHGHSWELRSMEDAAEALNFTKWGLMNAKPIPPVSGSHVHAGIIVVVPPVTATWRFKKDLTTVLVVRAPLVIWREDDSIILPPDSASGVPFYVDPVERPGYHRDIFKVWARKLLGEFVIQGYPMSELAKTHLPREYQSEESSDEEEEGSQS